MIFRFYFFLQIFLIVCLLLPLLTQSSPVETGIDDISLDPIELTDLDQPDNDRIKRSGFSIIASLQKVKTKKYGVPMAQVTNN
jgi:hypothetical protein